RDLHSFPTRRSSDLLKKQTSETQRINAAVPNRGKIAFSSNTITPAHQLTFPWSNRIPNPAQPKLDNQLTCTTTLTSELKRDEPPICHVRLTDMTNNRRSQSLKAKTLRIYYS